MDGTFNSDSVIPSQKYLLDHGFRTKINLSSQNNIQKIWKVLLKNETDGEYPIPRINFPTTYANGEKISAADRKFSSDLIHFRVGPARLYQFRKETNSKCNNFELNWDQLHPNSINSTNLIPEWQNKSPFYQPWLYNNKTEYPGDWEPKTKKKQKWKNLAGCGYETEIGTSIATSKMILANLYQRNWLDNETESLFFEQTYFNPQINNFLLFRISFEHVEGGAFQAQLRIKEKLERWIHPAKDGSI